MAFQFIPVLKALVPIVASATGLGSWLANRTSDKKQDAEQRLADLENALLQQNATLTQLAEQVQVLTGHLAEKEEQIVRLQRSSVIPWIALFVALAALVAAGFALADSLGIGY